LRRVPSIIADASERWALTLGDVYDPGGHCSWAVSATRDDGTPAVLKVCLPHYEGEHEAEGLETWDGDGTVFVYEYDAGAGALLLERCEPGTPLDQVKTEDEQDEIVAALLRRLWRPPPHGHPFRPLSDLVAEWWMADLLEHGDTDRVDRGLVRTAIAFLDDLVSTTREHVLLTTDLHAENVLAAEREPWLVIDPKPFVGDPAFDATQHLFNCPERVIARPDETIARFSGLLGVDATRVRSWFFARAVAEGQMACAHAVAPGL
jgi:streptomycin 6-kinase